MDSVILKMSPRIIMMASWEQSEKPRQRKLKESDLKPREASAKLLCANLIQFWKRDRLRAVECPKEIIDQVGGWSSSDVGESYGEGFPLDNVSDWINKLLLIS